MTMTNVILSKNIPRVYRILLPFDVCIRSFLDVQLIIPSAYPTAGSRTWLC